MTDYDAASDYVSVPSRDAGPVREQTRAGGDAVTRQTVPTVGLKQLLESNTLDIVDIGDDAILLVEAPRHVVAPVRMADPDIEDIQMGIELGRSGPSSWTGYMREEYNPELRDHLGLMKYDRMRRSDSAVRSALRVLKTPVLGATWYVSPFDESAQSREIAQFVQRNFTQYMPYSWTQVVWEALLMLDFGHYLFEKVYDFKEVDGQLRVIYRKLAPRHPLDVVQWNHDANGGPSSVDLYDSPGGEEHVRIPIEKLAVFSFDSEGGDLRGISVLRSAYKHWFFKENLYKIDAIQKERHGIGIPVIKLPPGFNPKDRAKAHEIGRNLRTNEKAHIVLPPNWDIMFAKIEGQAVDALVSATHHTEMIFQNVLAQAIYASAEGNATAMMELFYKSTRHIADLVRNIINKYCIPYLVLANWGIEDYPELRVRRLGDTSEARTISFALRNLVGAGIVVPDDDLEEWSREIIDAPKADPATRREVATPQGAPQPPTPGRTGPPRQSQASNQRGLPSGQAGRDRSGG